MINFHNVTYTYPATGKPALRNISFSIPAGQFCALVGPSEAGKSTLAYAIAGFIPHFYHGTLNGRVTVAGKDTQAEPLSELVRVSGLIFQNPFNQISGTKFSVREELAFGLENLGVPRAEMADRIAAIMDRLGITDLAERSPLSLSGGQMQRVAIASVLVMQPQVLVLDEPTAQLDPVGSREVFETIRAIVSERRTTVVMISHKLEWVAAFAERVVALAGGEVVADGEPGAVLADDALLAHGLGQTRYTQAARRARQLGKWPDTHRLPVTLEEAVTGFQDILWKSASQT